MKKHRSEAYRRGGRNTPLLWALLIALSVTAAMAAPQVETMPGYVELNLNDLPETEEARSSVEVFLRKPLLDMVSAAVRHDDAEFAQLLDRLHLIQARIFEDSPSPLLDEAITRTIKELDQKAWERVVRIREADERIDLYLKPDGETISGLFVAVRQGDGQEIVLVNIVGDIRPEELGRIGAKFNIVPLQGLGIGLNREDRPSDNARRQDQ